MANAIYNQFKADVLRGVQDLDGTDQTVKVKLVTSSYTPDIDAHHFISDVTNEVTGTGYASGGASLANMAVSIDDTDDEGVFDADNVTWASSTITAAGAVLYKDTGTAGTSPLICYFDFGGDQSSSSGNFTITWNSEGIVNIN